MKKYLDRIKKFGHKITYQRMEILRVLFKHEELLTVKRLHLKLKNRIDLASVYRTINLFKDLKIIFEEKINDQSFYYLSDHPHHHIMCRNCGFIKCIPCQQEIPKIKDFTEVSHQLTLKGLCKKCSNNLKI